MSTTSVKIQMFRLNELGDCFLLTFTDGAKTGRMLIDCGSFRNGKDSIDRIKEIAGEIHQVVGVQGLDVVVGTHQHNDHLSGFVHAKEEFQKIGIGQVWLSWLDNPADPYARRIGDDHHNIQKKLAAARDALAKNPSARKGAAGKRSFEVLNDVLGFYGASAAGMPPELPRQAVEILKSIGEKKPRYLSPGKTLAMPGFSLESFKIHVLGPPREHDLLYRKDPKKGESYDHALAAADTLASRFLSAVDDSSGDDPSAAAHYPFAARYKAVEGDGSDALEEVVKRYKQSASSWRKIDDDWLMQAEKLALFLDTFTNNSSLVLAIEMVKSGKVLLFAADAQTGNWISWDQVEWEDKSVNTDDLLARSVFYKVGHHASHNATLVDAFEKMNHPDLVALIPVHKKDPNITKVNGWKMPAEKLFTRLKQKTENRVLQMDGDNPPECNPAKAPAKAKWAKVGIKPKITNACVEIEIKG